MLQSLYTSVVIDQIIHDRAAAAAPRPHRPEPPPPPVRPRPGCSSPLLPHRPPSRKREPVSELPGWNTAEPTSIMDVVLRRVSSATFVGRADELALLDGALDCSRTPSFAFVAGESGVGKSRLVAEFEARATAAGARVLIGHCLELGGTVFPYAPAGRRPPARRARARRVRIGPRAPRRHARGPRRTAPRVRRGPRGGASTSQARLFEALLALIERLGRQGPVALVLEDLHWADPSTRDFLVFLVRSARTEPVTLLATYRSDELHRRHPLRPVLAELERVPGVQRIALERFSREEVDQQLAGILDEAPDQTLGDRLYARGQGNPLYTEELLAASAAGVGELPETLRDALLGRFERLPSAAQEVAARGRRRRAADEPRDAAGAERAGRPRRCSTARARPSPTSCWSRTPTRRTRSATRWSARRSTRTCCRASGPRCTRRWPRRSSTTRRCSATCPRRR